jgi:hypothetical protein
VTDDDVDTSIGHQILVNVNLFDQAAKRKEKEKELARQAKQQRTKDSTGVVHENQDLEGDDSFVLLLQEERNLLISDPRGNYAIQDHNQAHVFSYATRIYWHMMRERENQVVVMSYV